MVLLFQGSGEASKLYLRAFGWHWAATSSLIYLSVCAVCLAQDVVLSVWTQEAKEVQGLEEWRELRDSRLAAYALLGLLQGHCQSVCCVFVCLFAVVNLCICFSFARVLRCLLSDMRHSRGF